MKIPLINSRGAPFKRERFTEIYTGNPDGGGKYYFWTGVWGRWTKTFSQRKMGEGAENFLPAKIEGHDLKRKF